MEHKHVQKVFPEWGPIVSLFLKPILVELIFLAGKNLKTKRRKKPFL